MSSIKAPVKREHYRLWAGEVTMVIQGDDGSLEPLTIRTNGLSTVKEPDKILPKDLQRGQTVLQQQVFKSMGAEYTKVKDVLAVTVLFTTYMGFLSQEDMEVERPPVKVPEAASNDPFGK